MTAHEELDDGIESTTPVWAVFGALHLRGGSGTPLRIEFRTSTNPYADR